MPSSTGARGHWPRRCSAWACSKGERVATLCWNHHAHLEAYFGIPAAGGVMHTLNLRLSPDEIGWIAGNAQDRFLIVDDILLPLYRQFAHLHRFEKVIVFPFSGAPVPAEFVDYEALAGRRRPRRLPVRAARRERPGLMCYTCGTTGRPKGVVYSHRSTVLHTLVACLARLPGLEEQRRGAAGDADVPRQQLGHALWRGDDRRQAGLPRAAPAPGRPARPDAAGAADAVARRADDLDEPDPGLRARR